MKKEILLINLKNRSPIARDIELSRTVATLERKDHLNGGLIIPGTTSFDIASRYCKKYAIEVTRANLTTPEQAESFYASLEKNRYAQIVETIRSLDSSLIERIIKENRFTPSYFG